MKAMYFISRHTATPAQILLARNAGYILYQIGDVDAFDTDAVRAKIATRDGDIEPGASDDGQWPPALPAADAICCVHPAVALIAAGMNLEVGIFQNANRAPEGEKPSFEAVSLHMYRVETRTQRDIEEELQTVTSVPITADSFNSAVI